MLLEHIEYIESGQLDFQDGQGNTALLLAVKAKDVDFIQKLLDLGVDTELRNDSGDTTLVAAVRAGEEKLVKQLLPTSRDGSKSNIDGGGAIYPTALYVAASCDNED